MRFFPLPPKPHVFLTTLLVWSLAAPMLPAMLAARASQNSDATVFAATVRVTEQGSLVEWRSDLSDENLGFNVYRIEQGQRTKLNEEIIPGGVFLNANVRQRGGRAFAFLDKNGTKQSTYFIEALTTNGVRVMSEPVQLDRRTVSLKSGLDGSTYSASGNTATENTFGYQAAQQQESSPGTLEDQWTIVAQSALKIGIKRDGWYRVTHAQSASAGFTPYVDIKNLRLYGEGKEVAILTSKGAGPFESGDYFEFFGRGLDTSTSSVRTYYLIAGSEPGKRVRGELHTTAQLSLPPHSSPTLRTPLLNTLPSRWFGFVLTFINGINKHADDPTISNPFTPAPTLRVSASRKPATPKKNSKAKKKRASTRQFSHASVNSAAAITSFTYTVERKDRLIYFSSLLNGDTENYFGQVLSSTPVMQNLTILNPDQNAATSARLEVALQGVGNVQHQVNVSFNSSMLGTLNFFGLAHQVQTFNIPVSSLNNGGNSITFTSTIPGTVSLVDYVRVTYPHLLRADNNALRLSLRPSQSVSVDGFTSQNIRVIDVSDPLNPEISNPAATASAGAFAIHIQPSAGTRLKSKTRLLYAQPDTQFETPDSFSLNQPSSLNATSNGADLLIIAHKDLINTVAPLVSLRQSQGLVVAVANVDDVYDEFGYGAHGPQALRSFLSRTASTWSRAPRYVFLVGDASLDPRNYQGFGDIDMVPTKLVDATFNETASDDWLSDFNDDGVPEIPIGRLPARTVAEANLVISKITNFLPAAVPQSALLVADDPTGFYFDFEQANDEVQALLPPSMTVQRVNKRTEPDTRSRVISNFNSGQALVNYTGHGNVDTWMGSSVFSSTDAAKLTNAVSIVISQVYGGGGDAGATLRNDYIELFNRGAWPVRLGGWSVQYAAANGSTWQVTTLPDLVIPPGKYFLVEQAQGAGGTIGLPTPDAQGTIDLDATSGKVALLNTTTALSGSGCPTSVNVVDLVGYGAANCSLGSPASALTTSTATVRNNSGCADTRVNSADFNVGAPVPRNSTSAANNCIDTSNRLPLSFVVVMDCLNGYFQDPVLQGLGEALMNAPNGGAVAVFASSGLTIPDGQHAMATQLYTLLYGSQSIPLGDAVKTAKAATPDIDVRRTWILFGDPSMRIR